MEAQEQLKRLTINSNDAENVLALGDATPLVDANKRERLFLAWEEPKIIYLIKGWIPGLANFQGKVGKVRIKG